MTDRHLRELARELSGLRRDVRTLSTKPQLAHSSVEDGSVNVYDLAGQVSLILGKQYDGTYTGAHVSGPVPAQPAAGALVSLPGGVLALYDGTFFMGAVAPMDFSRFEIHVDSSPTFTPSFVTLKGTIESPRGGELPVLGLAPGTYYLKIVARSLAGKASEPSPAVSGEALADATQAGADALAAAAAASAAQTAADAAQGDADAAAAAALAAQQDADLLATPLIDNPSVTGLAGRWRNVNSGGTSTMVVENQTFLGKTIPTLKLSSDGSAYAYSMNAAADPWFKVDPSKAYEFTVYTKSQRPNGGASITYLGLHVSNADGTSTVDQAEIIDSPPVWVEQSNHYFWSSSVAEGDFVRHTGYVVPTGTDAADVKGLGVNVTRAARMKPNARTMRMRVLNFSNTLGPNHLWISNPTVREFPTVATLLNTLRTQAATAQARADLGVANAATAQATADGKVNSYFQTTAPTGLVTGDVGDLWFDTDDGYKMHRWTGTAWEVSADTRISTALNDAAVANAAAGNAQTAANSKIVTFYQASAPSSTGRTTGDLWVDTDDGDRLYRWSGSAWVVVKMATEGYTQSRGMQLVTNGTGLMGSNYNFSAFTFDAADHAPGAAGSFYDTSYNSTRFNDELIPVDPNKTVVLTGSLRQRVAGIASRAYLGVAAYDIDGLTISPFHFMRQAGTLTTLAAPLNPGDTTITLTSAANWNNAGGTSTHFRSIVFWDYVDGKGYAWPAETYSRNFISAAWAVGGINFTTNVITLSAPYSGPAKPAGTKVSNNQSGGSYKYIAASNVIPGDAWTSYSGAIGGGIDYSGLNDNYKWPPGTAFGKLLFLGNRDVMGGQHSLSGVSLSEVAGQNLLPNSVPRAAAAFAITTYRQNSAPTTGMLTGDVWIDADDNNTTYRYDGTSWVITRDAGIAAAQALAAGAAAADAINTNPLFSDWTGTYPAGWKMYNAPSTKETALARTGNAVRMATTDATLQKGLQSDGVMTPLPLNTEYVTVEADVYLVSGTFSGAGVLLDWAGMTGGNRAQIEFNTEVPAPATGKWYRFRKTLRRPTTATGTQTSWITYLMGNYPGTGFGASAVKDIIFDRVSYVPASAQEIQAYNAATAASVTTLTATVNTKTTTYYQISQPPTTGRTTGDIWVDTDADNLIYVWNGAWTATKFKAGALDVTARQLGALTTYYQASQPATGVLAGDFWLDTDDAQRTLYTYNGSTWEKVQNAALQQALDAAGTAQGTADGKVRVFAQATAPTGLVVADLDDVWIDTDDGNKWYTWSGTAWAERQLGTPALATDLVLRAGQKLVAGNPAAAHASMMDDGFRVYRFTPDGVVEEAIRMGTSTDDLFAMTGADGALKATIDNTGRLSVNDVVTQGLTFQGRTLQSLLDEKSRGVVTFGFATTQLRTATTSEIGWFEVSFVAKPGRYYRVSASALALVNNVNGKPSLNLKMTDDGSTPSVATPLWAKAEAFLPAAGHGFAAAQLQAWRDYNLAPSDTQRTVRILLSHQSGGGVASEFLVVSGTPVLLLVEDIGPHVWGGHTNTTGGGTTAPARQSYTREYAATWSGTYASSGALDTSKGNLLTQGAYAGSGVQKGMAGFDDAAIRADLAGATIDRVQIYLYANHWYYNSGGQAEIGTHNVVGRPGSFSSSGVRASSAGWPKPGGRWVDLPLAVGNELRDNTAKGITVAAGLASTDLTFYGKFDGVGAGGAPKLSITYTK